MAPAHRHPGDVGITSPDHRPTPEHRGRGMATDWRSFASDNYAGPHPDVLAAVAASTAGHAGAYGDDDVTARLDVAVKREFGPAAEAFPTFNGTGANVVALASLVRGRGAVVCADTAHVHVDEGGAPEAIAGLKLWTVPTPDGWLTPGLVDAQAWGFDDVHRARPAVVSITQSTESGTVYSPAEIAALADHAHARGMRLHVDGARLANAAASLGVSLGAVTSAVGVDAAGSGGRGHSRRLDREARAGQRGVRGAPAGRHRPPPDTAPLLHLEPIHGGGPVDVLVGHDARRRGLLRRRRRP